MPAVQHTASSSCVQVCVNCLFSSDVMQCTGSPPPPPFLGPLLFVAENGLEGHGYWVLGQPGYIGEEADRKMWWLIGRAPDYCGKSPGFESFLSREGRQSPS